jgi:MFS transporter, DHA1 family, inner membrane transport protein
MTVRARTPRVDEHGARGVKPRGADGLAAASRARVGLAVLGLGAFTVGTSELVVVGILDQLADDAGISIGAAGSLVTAYALGVALGGPLLTALTGGLERRAMLRLALAGYAAANLATAAAASFAPLFVSRLVAGSLHGAFIGVATVVAAGLAAPGREGHAIAVVFGGVALSTVVGVPLGTLVGQSLGWQATFLGIAVLGALALLLNMAFVPRVRARGTGRLSEEARSALTFPVLATLAIGLLIIGGQFTVLTYLAPFLDRVSGVSGEAISGFLLAFGVATAIGTFAGGRAADRSASGTLIVGNAGVAAMLLALYLAGSAPGLTLLIVVGWGLIGFGLVSTALQVRVIGLAGRGGDLAASLGASAANAGIAIAALVGGQVVANLGVRDTALVGALILLACLPATVAARSLRPAAPGGRVAGAQIRADAGISAGGGRVGR